jgi:choline kinase
LGQTKALIDVLGRPLIHWQLDGLTDVRDLRIVVGYNGQSVIDAVLAHRRDAMFVVNHDYETTATGDSLALAARHAADDVVSIDGDLLLRPSDIARLLGAESPVLGVTPSVSDQAVYVNIAEDQDGYRALGFHRGPCGPWEWTGLVKCAASVILAGARGRGPHHVFQVVDQLLPCRAIAMETREIDTAEDYERAGAWLAEQIEGGLWK